MSNDLSKLQDVEYEMLHEFKMICERYGFRYYIIDGTLLGSIRHKGFIPWDDDIDVAMPRSDYNVFMNVVGKELPQGMEFKTYSNDPNYHRPFARIVNHKVHIINHGFSQGKMEPAWIDIFTLDGAPKQKLLMDIHKVRLLWRKVTIGWANYKDIQDAKPNRPWYEKILIFIGKTIKPGRFMSLTKQYEKLDKALMKYSDEESQIWINLNGGESFDRMSMDKDLYFGKGSDYEFHGEMFRGPENYDAYLKKIYGEYMTPPSEGERNKHSTELLIEE